MTNESKRMWEQLAFKPSEYFQEHLSRDVQENYRILRRAAERAACVACAKSLQGCTFVTIDAADFLEISRTDLAVWLKLVEGWHEAQWFYVLFLDLALEEGLIPVRSIGP
jgi:hypothetical protein